MPVTPLSVFISYSRTDTDFVNRLDADLKTHGFRTWVDRGRLEGGDEWLDIIQQAIEDCDVLLVVLSPDAINSRFVKIEYRHAQREDKVVIPLYYRRCAKVPMDLNDIQWVNFLEPDNIYNNALQGVLLALRLITPSQEQIKPSPGSHQEITNLVEEAKEPPLVAPQPAPPLQSQPPVIIEDADKTVTSNRPASAIPGSPPPRQQSGLGADHIGDLVKPFKKGKNNAKSLRDEAQVEGTAKKGRLFGTPKARPVATPNSNGNNEHPVRAEPLTTNPPSTLVNTPRTAQPFPYRDGEEDNHAGGSVAPFAAGTALGGAAALGADHFMDAHNNSGNGAGLAYQNDPNTPGNTDPLAPHDFADDEDNPGLPPASHATPDDVSGPMQAVPSPGATANNVIELPRRGRATLPLSQGPSSPVRVPLEPVRSPEPESTTKLPRPQRTSGKMPAAGLAGAAPPTRSSGAVAGSTTGAVVPPTGGGANLPPDT